MLSSRLNSLENAFEWHRNPILSYYYTHDKGCLSGLLLLLLDNNHLLLVGVAEDLFGGGGEKHIWKPKTTNQNSLLLCGGRRLRGLLMRSSFYCKSDLRSDNNIRLTQMSRGNRVGFWLFWNVVSFNLMAKKSGVAFVSSGSI